MRMLFLLGMVFLTHGCIDTNDDEIELGFPDAKLEVFEPSSGSKEIIIPIKVMKNDFPEKTIRLSIAHHTTSDKDVSLVETEITTTQGSEEVEAKLLIHADKFYETTETFELHLDVLKEDDVSYSIKSMTISIVNDNPEPVVYFKENALLIPEGVTSKSINLLIDNPPENIETRISFKISGNAKPSTNGLDGDYSINDNEFIFKENEFSSEVAVEVRQDNLREGKEIIEINLQPSEDKYLLGSDKLLITIPGEYRLNDTGFTKFLGASGITTDEYESYPDQDAHNGFDSIEKDNTDGYAGFKFTKIDFHGNALQSDSPNAECITDERTGLMWELKHQDLDIENEGNEGNAFNEYISELVRKSKLEPSNPEYQHYPFSNHHDLWRSAGYSYYWKNDSVNNGGFPGIKGVKMDVAGYPIQQFCAYPNESSIRFNPTNLYCDTQTYIDFSNSIATCGHKSWRLPTPEELRSLVNYDIDKDIFDPLFFPHPPSGKILSNASVAVEGDGSEETGQVWCLDTHSKQLQKCKKNTPNKIILVRDLK